MNAPARVLALSTTAFTAMFAVWLMFAVIGIPIQKEFHLTDVELSWLGAVAVLNGAIWRLVFGIVADRLGGRRVFVALLVGSAIASLAIVFVKTFAGLLACAFLVGIAGNSFSAGIAWNAAWFPRQRQGVALGTFGAGNVGASVTKLFGPTLIAAVPATGIAGILPGGWRIVPVAYTLILLFIAAAVALFCPRDVEKSGPRRSIGELLRPLNRARVWRFSLYYVVVFGAYVALSLALPKYYMGRYGLPLGEAGLLAALFIFPASLLRPLGGYLSDRLGPRGVMYVVFAVMLAASAILAGDRSAGYAVGLWPFVVVVFVIGIAMGLGKAAVYKYIAEFYPKDVAAVGGVVGALGALGGFVLPLFFAYLKAGTGLVQAPFVVLLVLTAASFGWLHAAVMRTSHAAPAAAGAS